MELFDTILNAIGDQYYRKGNTPKEFLVQMPYNARMDVLRWLHGALGDSSLIRRKGRILGEVIELPNLILHLSYNLEPEADIIVSPLGEPIIITYSGEKKNVS